MGVRRARAALTKKHWGTLASAAAVVQTLVGESPDINAHIGRGCKVACNAMLIQLLATAANSGATLWLFTYGAVKMLQLSSVVVQLLLRYPACHCQPTGAGGGGRWGRQEEPGPGVPVGRAAGELKKGERTKY